MTRMSRMAFRQRTLLLVRKMFILVDESWFRTYVTDVFGFVNGCYVGQGLDGRYIELLEVSKEKYEAFEKVDSSTIVLSTMYYIRLRMR